MSKIFEIVQAMSGQKNCIVIPCPYLEFFAGDQQVFALSAVLNQLVFWSGKSSLEDGWFYKSHEDLASEIRGLSEDQVQRVIKKLSVKYLPGIIEVCNRKVNGTPTNHYLIDGDALIAKIFPSALDSAELRNGKREDAESNPQNCGMENVEVREQCREVAESYLYPDQYTDHYKQISKPYSLQNSDESSNELNAAFLSRHPDAVIYTPSGKFWGTAEDLKAATYIFTKIADIDETAKKPSYAEWANDIRLMRDQDGRNHREICELFLWANHDPFWQDKILSPKNLRKKWGQLHVQRKNSRANPSNNSHRVTPATGETPPGFMSPEQYLKTNQLGGGQ